MAEQEFCGVICVNKPAGFTSFDVIAKMRGILGQRRLGHGGTLDPMATGVLPVFAGRATMAADILPDSDKAYRAGFRLGVTTDSQDITGTVTAEKSAEGVTRNDVETALERFRGDITQIPPMYSAVSVDGKRLYELARQGVTVERKPRPVTVHGLTLTGYEGGSGTLEISCSKGTYVRTLINDMGETLGCGAVMTSLVRTRACGFSLADCVTLEQLSGANDITEYLLPVERLFEELPRVRLDREKEKMYRNGVKLRLDRLDVPQSAARVRVYGGENFFIGTALPDREKGVLRVEKNFYLD